MSVLLLAEALGFVAVHSYALDGNVVPLHDTRNFQVDSQRLVLYEVLDTLKLARLLLLELYICHLLLELVMISEG